MADAVAPALAIGARGRSGRLLAQRVLLRRGLRAALGRDVPRRFAPLGAARPGRADFRSPSSHSLPVHPTQLYSALDGLLILALLTAYFPRRRRDGEVMALLMVTYPVTRFLIEGLRDDEPALLAGLTMSQWISVGVFAGGLVAWAYLLPRPLGRFADSAPSRPTTAGGPRRAAAPGNAFASSR